MVRWGDNKERGQDNRSYTGRNSGLFGCIIDRPSAMRAVEVLIDLPDPPSSICKSG